MASLYSHKSHNVFRTWLLMAAFFGLVIIVGYLLAVALESPGILYVAVIFSILTNIGAYWWSHKLVLKLTRAVKAGEQEYAELHRIVENLAITAGPPKPQGYEIKEDQPNAV